jgi:hypothetical protein
VSATPNDGVDSAFNVLFETFDEVAREHNLSADEIAAAVRGYLVGGDVDEIYRTEWIPEVWE